MNEITVKKTKAEMADRRLILAIAAENLDGLSTMLGEFVSVEAMREAGVIAPDGDPVIAICEFLADCGVWFGPRRWLEEDIEYRQLIPYIVMRNEDRFLVYQRADDIEEERLRGAIALGFGGHIDLPDARFNEMNELSLHATVVQGLQREAMEEVGMLVFAGAVDCMGLILAKEPMVSRVHVGLVLMVHVAGTVVSKESSQHSLQWMTADEIASIPEEKQEGWTRVLAPELVKLAVSQA